MSSSCSRSPFLQSLASPLNPAQHRWAHNRLGRRVSPQEGYIRLIRHEDEGTYCGWDNTPSHGSLCADEHVDKWEPQSLGVLESEAVET